MNRVLIIILALLVLGGAAVVARAEPAGRAAEARHHFERGNALYQQGRYDDAVAELQAGYAIDPRPDFLYALGQAERKRGDCSAAIRYYQKYVDSGQSPQRTVAVLVQIDRCKQELAAAPASPAKPKPPVATSEPPSPPPSASPTPSSPTPSSSSSAAVPSPPPSSSPPPVVAAPAPAASPSPVERAARPATRDRRPVYKRWWLWTLVGLGVAGAAVGVAVVLTQQRPFSSTLPDLVVGNAAVRF